VIEGESPTDARFNVVDDVKLLTASTWQAQKLSPFIEMNYEKDSHSGSDEIKR